MGATTIYQFIGQYEESAFYRGGLEPPGSGGRQLLRVSFFSLFFAPPQGVWVTSVSSKPPLLQIIKDFNPYTWSCVFTFPLRVYEL